VRLLKTLVHRPIGGILPDPSLHVSRARGKQVACGARGNRDDGVLVSLEHHLGITSLGIPELDSTILGARHDPFATRSEADGENVVLYAPLSDPLLDWICQVMMDRLTL
jgi:hypothetical protein